MEYVYLIPHADGTYEACVCARKPGKDAAKLTAEGAYPVEYYYRRLDVNGDSIIESEWCQDRQALIHNLNCDGQALHTIRSLWKFDSYRRVPAPVAEIFRRALAAWAALGSSEDWD